MKVGRIAWAVVAAFVFVSPGGADEKKEDCVFTPPAPNQMVVYEVGEPIPNCQLMDLGDPAGLGGTVLEGDPKISARIDFSQNGLTAGVFQATRGKVLIHFPFDEHATIIAGSVTLTDESGRTHTYRPGDSYFIQQGSNILWDVKGRRVQKSFLNFVRPQ